MKNGFENKRHIVFGLLCIIVGILCNEWVLAALFSSDATLDASTRIAIWSFNLLLIAMGIIVLISKKFRTLLSLFYALTVSLILLEMFLRFFDPMGISFYFEAARYFRKMIPDQDFAYIHAPGYHDKLQGVEVSINSEGFRGPEFQVHKTAGRKRLLILGDSVVFGWGAPQNSIFPIYLQKMLDNKHIECEVIAAGVGSWNTRTEYAFLKKRGVEYSPDILLLVATSNDIQPIRVRHTYVSEDNLFPKKHNHSYGRLIVNAIRVKIDNVIEKSYLLMSFAHNLSKKNAHKQIAGLYKEDSPTWEDAQAALLDIINICRQKNIQLFVYLYGDNASGSNKAFIRAYGDFLFEQGVSFYLFPKALFDLKYFNSSVDTHPNALGHRIMAEEIFKTLPPILPR